MQDPDGQLGATVEPVAMGRQLQLGLVSGQERCGSGAAAFSQLGKKHGISTTADPFPSIERRCVHPFLSLGSSEQVVHGM